MGETGLKEKPEFLGAVVGEQVPGDLKKIVQISDKGQVMFVVGLAGRVHCKEPPPRSSPELIGSERIIAMTK